MLQSRGRLRESECHCFWVRKAPLPAVLIARPAMAILNASGCPLSPCSPLPLLGPVLPCVPGWLQMGILHRLLLGFSGVNASLLRVQIAVTCRSPRGLPSAGHEHPLSFPIASTLHLVHKPGLHVRGDRLFALLLSLCLARLASMPLAGAPRKPPSLQPHVPRCGYRHRGCAYSTSRSWQGGVWTRLPHATARSSLQMSARQLLYLLPNGLACL